MAHTITRLPRGSDSQFGFVKQSAYATAVTPVTGFLEAVTLGLAPKQEIIEPKSIKPGLRGKRHNMRVPWNRGGEGPIVFEVPYAGSLGLWQAAFGGSNTCTQQDATAAYLATFQPGAMSDANGCSLTMQMGVPLYSGVVEPFTFSGCMVKGWKASCEEGGILTATLDIDAQVWEHATDLAAPSYTAGTFFNWTMSPAVKRAGTVLPGVRKADVSIENGLNTDRNLLDGTGKKAQPVESALRSCSLELEIEPTDLAKTWDDLTADTGRAWVFELLGSTAIASTYYPFWRLTIAEGHLVGDPITVDGPDEVLQKVTIEALDNGTDPLYKLELMTTDTAIP